jgi:L-lactate dehydrogenase complex protein LldE
MKVQLFIPCFMDQLYPQTAMNTLSVLEKAGCEVLYNTQQTCCGQPAFNAGFVKESEAVCTKFIHDMQGADYIVTPSASCCGFVKNYYSNIFEEGNTKKVDLTIKDRIFELSDFLVNILQIKKWESNFEGKVTYHDSCAALRECHIKNEPRQLLSYVKGLSLQEMEDTTVCCGFGGSFAVKFQDISIGMGTQKVEQALQTKADYIVSTDISCLMHLEGYINKNGIPIKVMHIADILAA